VKCSIVRNRYPVNTTVSNSFNVSVESTETQPSDSDVETSLRCSVNNLRDSLSFSIVRLHRDERNRVM
jgi:hypothetical protein